MRNEGKERKEGRKLKKRRKKRLVMVRKKGKKLGTYNFVTKEKKAEKKMGREENSRFRVEDRKKVCDT